MADESVGYGLGRQQRRLRSGGDGGAVRLRVPLPVRIGAETVTEQVVAARLATVTAQHEALRTQVLVPAGLVDPVQLVGDTPTLTARVLDSADGNVLELAADALVADLASLQQVADVVCGHAVDAEDPIQFAEYTQWQDELAAAPADGSVAFWSTFDATVWTPLPATTTAALPAPQLAAGKVSWLGLLCCALAILSGDETIAFGVEVDARHGDELTSAVGPYAEVLPLVVDIDAEDTVRDVAQRCQAQLDRIEAFHEWAPDWLPTRPPVVLGFGDPAAVVARPGAGAELRVAADGSAFVVDPAAGFDAAVGPDAGGAGRDVLAATLSALSAVDPESKLGELDVLAAAGLTASDAAAAPVSVSSVLGAIDGWAQRTPDRVAVRARGASALTYGELAAAIGETLDRIAAHGPSASPIAVLADRSVGAVVGVLAALWSGRGYLPLDAAQPPARLRAALDDCGCTLLLADAAAELGGFDALGDRELPVERLGPWSRRPGADRPALPDPQALAYVIYTSGSAGAAKGVEVSLANLDCYVAGVRAALRLADGWNWALASLLSTDLGNTAVFGALVGGGTLTVLDGDEVLDPELFTAALHDGQVDAIKITPTHLASLLGATDAPLPRELVVLGGEMLPWALVDRIRDLDAGVRIANHYGPTETTVGVLTHEVTAAEDRGSASVPIGRPLPGVQVTVRTAGGAGVPIGAAGELRIGGGGVARGYRNDPARTGQQFVDGPQGSRHYRTGDIVRMHADGEVEFLGRRDSQVKVRGYRVDTGEIEAALLRHPGVQRAAIVPVVTDPAAGLAAYFVSHYHPSPAAGELREHLARSVPPHMVPTWFVELDRLPLTGNGKLDRRALPEPTSDLDQLVGYAEPSGLIEAEVAAIFADLLHQERVGRLDDFFRLGGHSLLATQVVVRIRQSLTVELPIQSIFVYPTVHALAGEIEARLMADIDELPADDVT